MRKGIFTLFRLLLKDILIQAEIILAFTEDTRFRQNAIDRIYCQKHLSLLCGIWHKFRRNWKPTLPCRHEHWAYLIAYHCIRYPIEALEEYHFQDNSRANFEHMRATVAGIASDIRHAEKRATQP